MARRKKATESSKPRCEMYERLLRIANAMEGTGASLTTMGVMYIDFETAAQMFMLGARPKKWAPAGGDYVSSVVPRVYYVLDIQIGCVWFTLYTVERDPLPYEMAPVVQRVDPPAPVVAAVVVVREPEPEPIASRTSLLEVN